MAKGASAIPLSIRLECDSSLVVDRLEGRSVRKKKDLKPLFSRARDELYGMDAFPHVAYQQRV